MKKQTKVTLRSLQNQLWWILSLFIAVTGMLMGESVYTRTIVSTTIFTMVILIFITWFAATVVYENDPVNKYVLGRKYEEYRGKPDIFFLILMAHIFIISMIWLPLAVYMTLNGGGKTAGGLYFAYSVGVSSWFASLLLIFRWWKASLEPKPIVISEEERVEIAKG